MKKKLLVPLILFLSITIAFLVQLKRNAQGEDIKALESALVGKPVPAKNLTELFENKARKRKKSDSLISGAYFGTDEQIYEEFSLLKDILLDA